MGIRDSGRLAGNQRLLKLINRARVLSLLDKDGQMSRARLADNTGLNGKTITNVVNALLKEGMVRPVGFYASTGGRPSEMLMLRGEYATAVGLDIGGSHVLAIKMDFRAQPLARIEEPVAPGEGRERILAKVDRVLEEMIEKRAAPRERCLGLGVAVPGVVDRERGMSVWWANVDGWRDLPLATTLRKRFQVEVDLEEATRTAACGEVAFGAAKGLQYFVYLDLSFGIGCAIGGENGLYKGFRGLSGEVGHTSVAPDGRPCRCGRNGCLEAEASGLAIAAKAREAVEAGKAPSLAALGDPLRLTAADVARAAMEGDGFSKGLLAEAGRYLGTAAANLVNLLNPQALVIGGGLVKAGELLLAPFRESLHEHCLPSSGEGLEVRTGALGDDAGALGAANLLRQRSFEVAGVD